MLHEVISVWARKALTQIINFLVQFHRTNLIILKIILFFQKGPFYFSKSGILVSISLLFSLFIFITPILLFLFNNIK